MMRTVGHVALFLALHSNTLWEQAKLPLGVSASHLYWIVAAPDVTLVTVVLGQGTKD